MLGFAHRRVCACLTGSLLVMQFSACTSWRVQNASAQKFTVRDAVYPVRVVRRDGSALTLNQPRISGDTLYGFQGSQSIAIPLQEVQSIAARQPDSEKTFMLLTGLAVGVVVAVFVFFKAAESFQQG